MLEVELKFRVTSPDELTAQLRRLGAVEKAPIEQLDHYFAHPSRDFAATDEALRIRSVGERNFVTYKGPKLDATTKTRREIELPLASGQSAAEDFAELLLALGFRRVRTVRKVRTAFELSWQSRTVEVALDDVDGLGTFVEIETAADESDVDVAREVILSLASRLGLETGERRSYLEMLIESCGSPPKS